MGRSSSRRTTTGSPIKGTKTTFKVGDTVELVRSCYVRTPDEVVVTARANFTFARAGSHTFISSNKDNTLDAEHEVNVEGDEKKPHSSAYADPS